MKQGCLQSPLLFNLVMNDLLDIIEGSGIVEVKDDKIGGMAFADNLVLLCNDSSQMQLLQVSGKNVQALEYYL